MAKTVSVYRIGVGYGALVKDNFLVQAEDVQDAAEKGDKLNDLEGNEVVKIEYVGEMRS